MIPSGMITIPIHTTAPTTHTGADTHTTTITTDRVSTPGIQATVILHTITAIMNIFQISAAGEGTVRWHGVLTPLPTPGASQVMLPEEI